MNGLSQCLVQRVLDSDYLFFCFLVHNNFGWRLLTQFLGLFFKVIQLILNQLIQQVAQGYTPITGRRLKRALVSFINPRRDIFLSFFPRVRHGSAHEAIK